MRLAVETTPDGITETIEFHADGSFAVKRSEDVEPILDVNKRALASGHDGYSPTRELRKVASIPITVQMQWITRYGTDPLAKGNEVLLKRILNDPEWRYLRTAPGMI